MLLNGWKEISNHAHRGIRTVQRWERYGLPVVRVNRGSRSPVIARAEDLDEWLTRRGNSHPKPVGLIEIAEKRRAELRKQVDVLRRRRTELIRTAKELRQRSADLGNCSQPLGAQSEAAAKAAS